MEHFTPDRTAAGRRYGRTLGKLLPSSRLLSVLFCLLLNSLVYWCTQSMVAGRQLLDLTTSIDQMIPFDPRWVFIYVACFLFWAVGYVLMARLDRWYSIMTAEVLAKLICGIVFLLIPCTNVRPEITGTGPAQWLLGLIYRLDPPLDLLPSIHCLESWICFRGILRQRSIPVWYQIFSFVFAILVCLSTLFTRQHVLADVITGVALAEIMLQISFRRSWGARLRRWMEGLDHWLLGQYR